jgi:F0F1-type ATP synthase membrane subunit b/b'
MVDETRLQKIRMDLEKARARRDDWERKVKDLERKYQEAENTCIHEMVHAANLSPEQLAELIHRAFPPVPEEGTEQSIPQKEVE